MTGNKNVLLHSLSLWHCHGYFTDNSMVWCTSTLQLRSVWFHDAYLRPSKCFPTFFISPSPSNLFFVAQPQTIATTAHSSSQVARKTDFTALSCLCGTACSLAYVRTMINSCRVIKNTPGQLDFKLKIKILLSKRELSANEYLKPIHKYSYDENILLSLTGERDLGEAKTKHKIKRELGHKLT